MENGGAVAVSPVRRAETSVMRIGLAAFLLFLAMLFPLLLDGQAFSNDVLGISLAAGAVALTIREAREARGRSAMRTMTRVIAYSGILLMVLVFSMLPSAYRSQKSFNRMMNEMRQRAAPPVAKGLSFETPAKK
jgi:heme O synthase-like polyprenyltransferase